MKFMNTKTGNILVAEDKAAIEAMEQSVNYIHVPDADAEIKTKAKPDKAPKKAKEPDNGEVTATAE